MEITITGRKFEVTDSIRHYTENKVAKLPRYYDRVSMIEVILGRHEQHTYDIEIIAHIDRHEPLVAHGRGDDLYKSIDDTTDRMERRLTDHKERLRNRKHPAHQ